MSKMSLKQIVALNIFSKVIDEEAAQHPLRQLFWESTLRCNLRCRHCGSDCKISDVHPDMPYEDFEKVLLRIKEAYDPHRIMVILSGGEPLMREDIIDITRRITALGFPVGMVSNGRLMDDRKAAELVAAGLRSATISLDGLEEEHDWMRGVPGSFGYASHAIELLSHAPIAFDVVTCVNRRNYRQLSEIKEHLIKLGVKGWRLFTIFPVGRAASDPELILTQEEYRGLMDFIIATRKEGRIRASYACEGFLGPYEGKVRDHLFTCQAGLTVGGVRIDGGISACTSIRARYDQGNIYKDDFVEVWEHGYANMRDRSWARTEACAKCKYWKWCHGNGMHLRDEDGHLIKCNLEKLGFK